MQKNRAALLVLLGVAGVSVSGPLVKLALLAGATPVSVAFLRMSVTAAVLCVPAWRKGELAAMARLPRQDALLCLLAAVFLALHYAAWMTSLQKTSTFASVALVCTQPLFVALFSGLCLGERVPRRAIPGAVLAVAGALGIGLLSMAGQAGNAVGDLLALGGAVTMAGHWLCGRAVRRHAPPLGYMVCVYTCTALLLALLAPLMGGFAAPVPALLPIGLLILLCTLGGHALFTYALGFVSADVVSFALLGEPIGAGVFALLLFGERVGWPMLTGGALVIAGLWLYLKNAATKA
ncbi:MAG: DMT family transporter [Oscillospiraceae bacterium]|jgi:drug/metabolite transporter (DMT)-like permease|nr:DMT family transporter [Oscillospiraceae bacterium]